MRISSLFSDTYSFLKTLFSGEQVDILWGGEIWALSVIVIATVCTVLWKKKRFIHVKAVLAAILSSACAFYLVNAIAPMELARGGVPFESREGMIFGILWKPFYLMPNIGSVLDIYKFKMIYFLVIGFAAALLFCFAYKPQWFAVFAVGVFITEFILVLLDDLAHGGVVKTFDLSVPILCIPTMFSGWGLARLVIFLNRPIYNRFHGIASSEEK